jgi:hypothetical protein
MNADVTRVKDHLRNQYPLVTHLNSLFILSKRRPNRLNESFKCLVVIRQDVLSREIRVFLMSESV